MQFFRSGHLQCSSSNRNAITEQILILNFIFPIFVKYRPLLFFGIGPLQIASSVIGACPYSLNLFAGIVPDNLNLS